MNRMAARRPVKRQKAKNGTNAGRHPIFANMAAQTQFLEELAKSDSLVAACKAVGVSYGVAFRAMDVDPEFKAAVQEAKCQFIDSLRREAWRRGFEGWDERPLADKDGVVYGHVRKYSDTMLSMLLKRHDPLFRDSVKVEASVQHQHTHTISLEGLSDGSLRKLREVAQELVEMRAQESGQAGPPSGRVH